MSTVESSAPSRILVTGASRGIGRAVAERLLAEGREVVCLARDGDALRALTDPLERAHSLVRDLAVDPNAVAAAAELVGAPIDGLVHAAGVALHAPLDEIREAEIERMHRLHFVAPLELARGLAAQTERGSIVNVASTLGLRPAVGRIAYSASKAALISLTRSLALELAPRGVRVNAVAPGVVDTNMLRGLDLEALGARSPLGIGAPADVAGAVHYLLDARWVTGTILTVDGGLTAG